MKLLIGGISTVIAIFIAFVIQDFLPPMDIFLGARIILVPMIFCYAAMALPGWTMLILAFIAGLFTDLNYLHVVDGRVEIGVGWSIVYFVFLGLFAHGFQPAFQRGHWWIHILVSMAGTSVFLALQFAMISFRREGFVYNDMVFWRVIGPGLMAGLFALAVHPLVVGASYLLPDARARTGFRRR